MRSYQALVGWFEGLADPDPFTTDSFTAPWLLGSGWIFPESDRRASCGAGWTVRSPWRAP